MSKPSFDAVFFCLELHLKLHFQKCSGRLINVGKPYSAATAALLLSGLIIILNLGSFGTMFIARVNSVCNFDRKQSNTEKENVKVKK